MPCLPSSGPAVEFGMVYELIHKKIVCTLYAKTLSMTMLLIY